MSLENKKQWNIQALELDFINNQVSKCTTSFEISMVTALHGIEIKKLAKQLYLQNKLSPCGLAIAEKYGFIKE